MSGNCGPNCGCGIDFDEDIFSDVFAHGFGREHRGEDLASMAYRLGNMSKKEREAEIAKMPEHIRQALGIKTETVRKHSNHVISEAKLCGRDAEIEHLGEAIETYAHEVLDLDKKLNAAEVEKRDIINDFQERYAEQVKTDAKKRKKLKKKLSDAGDEIVRLQELINAKNHALSKLGNENKSLLQKMQAMEDVYIANQAMSDLITAIDIRANKPVLVEQIKKLKEMDAGNGASVADSARA